MSKNESTREHLINEITIIMVEMKDLYGVEEIARRILNHIEAKGGELK